MSEKNTPLANVKNSMALLFLQQKLDDVLNESIDLFGPHTTPADLAILALVAAGKAYGYMLARGTVNGIDELYSTIGETFVKAVKKGHEEAEPLYAAFVAAQAMNEKSEATVN